jgi:hypothetical protein
MATPTKKSPKRGKPSKEAMQAIGEMLLDMLQWRESPEGRVAIAGLEKTQVRVKPRRVNRAVDVVDAG